MNKKTLFILALCTSTQVCKQLKQFRSTDIAKIVHTHLIFSFPLQNIKRLIYMITWYILTFPYTAGVKMSCGLSHPTGQFTPYRNCLTQNGCYNLPLRCHYMRSTACPLDTKFGKLIIYINSYYSNNLAQYTFNNNLFINYKMKLLGFGVQYFTLIIAKQRMS